MLDPAIADFFEERKSAWMKNRIKPSMSVDSVNDLEAKANDKYNLKNWLNEVVKKARPVSTHPSTLSHPDAKSSRIFFQGDFVADGFLKSGNAKVENNVDVYGNAATDSFVREIYDFLAIEIEGKTVFLHLQTDSTILGPMFGSAEVKESFLKVMQESIENSVTRERVKQVYFPVDSGYHLLSILTPSGLIYEMKKRIDHIRFSDNSNEGRDAKRKSLFHENGFDDIPQLTVIGYGGAHPKNISMLSNKNGGKAYLLSSMPPELTVRNIRFPKRNFFGEAFRLRDCDDILSSLHGIFKLDLNNIHVREKRDRRIDEWFDRVVDRMWQLRIAQADTSQSVNFESLPAYQRIWLDQDCSEQRENSDDWLNKLVVEMADWLINAYRRKMRKHAIVLGDDEWRYIRERINQHRNREALR